MGAPKKTTIESRPLVDLFEQAVFAKPKSHSFHNQRGILSDMVPLSQIGG
jgi:hypothetical protein